MNFINTCDYYEPIETITIKEKSRMVDSLVVIRNKKTKKIVYVGRNRSMIALSEFFAYSAFGYNINNSESTTSQNLWPYISTTYNSELGLNSIQGANTNITDINQISTSTSPIDYNNYKICLFCIGTGGVTDSGQLTATARDIWINSDQIIPFKNVSDAKEIENSDRKYYGRKQESADSPFYYYFKKIDSINIEMKGNDSDKIKSENFSYKSNLENSGFLKVIVTCNLTIDEGDGNFISNISSISENSNNFSSLSLCFGYYYNSNNVIDYIGIRPATRINFTKKNLSDGSSYEIDYKMYF